jgi:hypothetical protein
MRFLVVIGAGLLAGSRWLDRHGNHGCVLC